MEDAAQSAAAGPAGAAGSGAAGLGTSGPSGTAGQEDVALPHEPLTALDLAELVLGLAVVGVETAGRVVERVRPPALVMGVLAAPLTSTLGHLGAGLRRTDWSQDLLRRGRSRRAALARRAEVRAQRVAAILTEALLDLVDLTDVVVDHVDLDAVVRAVDLDRAVARVDIGAIIDRVDIDAIIERVAIDAILDRVDVDEVVARADLDRAVARVDIGAIIDRVDIDAIIARVAIDAILDRVDVDEVVARADLDRAVARVDIGAILDRVDIDAIAQRLDLDAVVARLDIVALAEYVVEQIDLPGIIQSSSGAMASEGMREVRWQGLGADERVAHVVDRMLRRRPRTPGPDFPATEVAVRPVLPGPGGAP